MRDKECWINPDPKHPEDWFSSMPKEGWVKFVPAKEVHHTTLQPDPVCPHCGHVHRDAWEWHFGPDPEGSSDRECERCEQPFSCDRIITVEYTTKKLPMEGPDAIQIQP